MDRFAFADDKGTFPCATFVSFVIFALGRLTAVVCHNGIDFLTDGSGDNFDIGFFGPRGGEFAWCKRVRA